MKLLDQWCCAVWLKSDLSPKLNMSKEELTHLSLEKMSVFSQIIFSDAFSWIKIPNFYKKIH